MANENVNISLIIDTAASAKNLGQLKTSLKDLRKAFDGAEIGSENFYQLADAIDETVEKTRTLKNGIDNIKQFQVAGSVLTQTFALATSSIAAFASENEDLQKNLLKVQSALGIAQSFSGLADAIGKARAAGVALNATLLTNPYVLLGLAVTGAAIALIGFSNAGESAEEQTSRLTKELNGNAEAAKNVQEAYDKQKSGLLDLINIYFKVGGNIGLAIDTQKSLNKTLEETLVLRQKEIEAQEKRNALQSNLNDILDIYRKISDERFKEQLRDYDDENSKLERQIALRKEAGKDTLEEEIRLANQKLNQAKALEASYFGLDASQDRNEVVERNIKLLKEIEEITNKEFTLALNKGKMSADEFKLKSEDLKTQKEALKTRVAENDKLIEFNENLRKTTKQAQLAYDLLLIKQQEIRKQQELIATSFGQTSIKSIENLDELIKKSTEQLNIFDTYFNSGKEINQIYNEIIQSTGNLTVEVENQILALEKRDDLTEKEKSDLIKLKELLKQLNSLRTETQNKLNSDAEANAKYWSKVASDIQKVGTLIVQTSDIITTAVEQNSERRIAALELEKNTAISILDEQLKGQLLSQEEYDAKRTVLEQEYAKKVKEEKKKAFVAQKAADIIQATINTALAVSRALGEGGIAGPVFAAINGALGAAQIALIASQPVPEFKKGGVYANGGMVSGMGNGVSDNVNAKISNGESIINARSTQMFAPLLSAINQIGGGISFTQDSKIVGNPVGVKQNKTEKEIQNLSVNVSISEKEITESQTKMKKIATRTTF